MSSPISHPCNDTQEHFNGLCALAAGQTGGPSHKNTREMLFASGKQLTKSAVPLVKDHFEALPDRNPWHLCFALGLSWGRLAKAEVPFTDAATRFLGNRDGGALTVASTYHYERGPTPIEQSLRGALQMFNEVLLPEALPTSVRQCEQMQQRWLGRILGDNRPAYIGSWNATAMFMMALLARPELLEAALDANLLLPPGGPIFVALRLLHQTDVVHSAPEGQELGDESCEPGALYLNNRLIQEVRGSRTDWSQVDVHNSLYLLGTRLSESRDWVHLGPFPWP